MAQLRLGAIAAYRGAPGTLSPTSFRVSLVRSTAWPHTVYANVETCKKVLEFFVHGELDGPVARLLQDGETDGIDGHISYRKTGTSHGVRLIALSEKYIRGDPRTIMRKIHVIPAPS